MFELISRLQKVISQNKYNLSQDDLNESTRILEKMSGIAINYHRDVFVREIIQLLNEKYLFISFEIFTCLQKLPIFYPWIKNNWNQRKKNFYERNDILSTDFLSIMDILSYENQVMKKTNTVVHHHGFYNDNTYVICWKGNHSLTLSLRLQQCTQKNEEEDDDCFFTFVSTLNQNLYRVDIVDLQYDD